MADDKSSAFAFLLLICLCIDVTQSVIIVFFPHDSTSMFHCAKITQFS